MARALLAAWRYQGEANMLGRVFMFESDRTQVSSDSLISETVVSAIETGINELSGIRYWELTAPENPKPVFAILFADEQKKELFEVFFGPVLRLCGLRAHPVRTLEVSENPVVRTSESELEFAW
jgi:hypothetical protein